MTQTTSVQGVVFEPGAYHCHSLSCQSTDICPISFGAHPRCSTTQSTHLVPKLRCPFLCLDCCISEGPQIPLFLAFTFLPLSQTTLYPFTHSFADTCRVPATCHTRSRHSGSTAHLLPPSWMVCSCFSPAGCCSSNVLYLEGGLSLFVRALFVRLPCGAGEPAASNEALQTT